MTVKEIWKQFIETTKVAVQDAGYSIAGVAKKTWDLFKEDMIAFVKAVFSWLWNLIEGVCHIIWDALVIIASALLAAIKATLGLLCEYVIALIKKL